MKVKCPLIVSDGDGGCRRHGCGYRCDRFFMLDVDVATSDLIAELEKRRPDCRNCRPTSGDDEPSPCEKCVWRYYFIGNDNFKPSKGAK